MIGLIVGLIFVYLVIGFIIAVIYLNSLWLRRLQSYHYNSEDVSFAFCFLQILWPLTLGSIVIALFVWRWIVIMKKVSRYER